MRDESWETKEVSEILERSGTLTNRNEGQNFLNGRKSRSTGSGNTLGRAWHAKIRDLGRVQGGVRRERRCLGKGSICFRKKSVLVTHGEWSGRGRKLIWDLPQGF